MGYRTPNIDRIAAEGMRFTDSYGEQSCTAGRAAFALGQSVLRSGLSKVGMPGAPVGIQAEDPTVAELLKPLGYATGQFGKNHFGDRNEFLPTVHGFDEFFGNLYHLNAEQDPEDPDYPDPKEFPQFKARFGPRGVLRCWATDQDDSTEQPRWGRVGKQKIEDTGPLTTERMKTCDDEFINTAGDWIHRQHQAGKPWFCWLNTTHMHLRTHTKPESVGQAGRWQSRYHDTMIDHDRDVGRMLRLLDELEIADDTIVMYSTDNGPHMNSWPDGAMTPFRGEKDSNWEGAFRVPLLLRWPRVIRPGQVSNEIVQHHDWIPTFLAAAGDPDVVEKVRKGHQAAGKNFKVHLDGYNLLPYRSGEEEGSPSARGTLRQLEDGVRGAALPWHPAGVGGAVHAAANPQALQPANRSVRAGGYHVQHLLGLVDVEGVHRHGGARAGRGVPEDVQGVPAPPEGGQLHHRPSHGEDGGVVLGAPVGHGRHRFLGRHRPRSVGQGVVPAR
jgi:arylsulfatase